MSENNMNDYQNEFEAMREVISDFEKDGVTIGNMSGFNNYENAYNEYSRQSSIVVGLEKMKKAAKKNKKFKKEDLKEIDKNLKIAKKNLEKSREKFNKSKNQVDAFFKDSFYKEKLEIKKIEITKRKMEEEAMKMGLGDNLKKQREQTNQLKNLTHVEQQNIRKNMSNNEINTPPL